MLCILGRKRFQSYGSRKLRPEERHDIRHAHRDGRLHEALLDQYEYSLEFIFKLILMYRICMNISQYSPILILTSRREKIKSDKFCK